MNLWSLIELPRRIFQRITGMRIVRTSGPQQDKRGAGRIPNSGRINVLQVRNSSVGQP